MADLSSPTGLYKVLDEQMRPCNGGKGAYTVGKRRSVRGRLEACVRGIHVCTLEQLFDWLGPRIHPVTDASDERIERSNKTVLRWVVIGPAYETWNETTARLFAADCAVHVLAIFERYYPKDDRPRRAIEAARAFARGEIGLAELSAAESADWSAAWSAAWSAERKWQAERLAQYLSGEAG